jgi:hypothetical protein
MRITLEALDLMNAALSDYKVYWSVTQYHVTQAGKSPFVGAFHEDGGFLAAVLTLTGFGTDLLTDPEIAPNLAWRDAASNDVRRSRTGRFVFFAGGDFGKSPGRLRESASDAVVHRASQASHQSRNTWIVRMDKLDDPEKARNDCLSK